MGRKNKNIKIQLNTKIDELLRIGQKKIKNDPTNANRAEGIHSIKTAQTYRSVACSFGNYLKSQGIHSIQDISKEHVSGYMQSRAAMSAFTYSKDLAAINKLLNTQYTIADFGLRQRNHQRILNNRGLSKRDTSLAARNREQLEFVRAIGIRRESIATITPAQAVRDASGLVVGFSVTEKGGRVRNCVVLVSERERITTLVNDHIGSRGLHIPLFCKVDNNANPHYCRRLYAQSLYKDLQHARAARQDYYSGLRDSFINQQNFERAISRYSNTVVLGYERDILAEVSQNLGHNRLDVVIYHYMR